MKLATVFSGIGAIEQALLKLKVKYGIVFACDTGERYIDTSIDEIKKAIEGMTEEQKNAYIHQLYDNTKKHNYVKDSYFANYEISDDNWYDDIRFINGKLHKDQVDLFVGGSPCQSFSSVGFQGGLEDARGTLFYEYARLVKEIQPKVFIYENVRNLINHDHGNTWEVIKGIFDNLGYDYKFGVLNASDYGIPQSRRRLFVIGFRRDLGVKVEEDFKFPPATKKAKYNHEGFYRK